VHSQAGLQRHSSYAPYKANEFRIYSIADAEHAALHEAGFDMEFVKGTPGD
jgi:hypothetical protein